MAHGCLSALLRRTVFVPPWNDVVDCMVLFTGTHARISAHLDILSSCLWLGGPSWQKTHSLPRGHRLELGQSLQFCGNPPPQCSRGSSYNLRVAERNHRCVVRELIPNGIRSKSCAVLRKCHRPCRQCGFGYCIHRTCSDSATSSKMGPASPSTSDIDHWQLFACLMVPHCASGLVHSGPEWTALREGLRCWPTLYKK